MSSIFKRVKLISPSLKLRRIEFACLRISILSDCLRISLSIVLSVALNLIVDPNLRKILNFCRILPQSRQVLGSSLGVFEAFEASRSLPKPFEAFRSLSESLGWLPSRSKRRDRASERTNKFTCCGLFASIAAGVSLAARSSCDTILRDP